MNRYFKTFGVDNLPKLPLQCDHCKGISNATYYHEEIELSPDDNGDIRVKVRFTVSEQCRECGSSLTRIAELPDGCIIITNEI